MLDNNIYYTADGIIIFPSSNAVDSGKLFTEFNGRKIVLNIVDQNFVVSPNPGGYDVTFDNVNSILSIAPGDCVINGFNVTVTETLNNVPLPDISYIITNEESEYKDYAMLCLQTMFDPLNNISGDIRVDNTWYCEGIRIDYVSYDDYIINPNKYLILCGVDTEGNIKENKSKYSKIDAKSIFVDVVEDDETKVPPEQKVSLDNFLNNILKSYWVSKAGDNEYGKILFREQPEGYLSPEFDYNTEAALTDENFKTSIDKNEIILKDNVKLTIIDNMISFNNIDTNEIIATIAVHPEWGIATVTGDINKNINFLVNGYSSGEGSVQGKLSIEKDPTNIDENKIIVYANSIIDGETPQTENYLLSAEGTIKTHAINSGEVELDSFNSIINIISKDSDKNTSPQLKLEFTDAENNIITGKIQLILITDNENWKNVIGIKDNLKIQHDNLSNGGNLQAEGFIYAGIGNPTTTIVNDGGVERNLKTGDIYGSQVWSSVYNDYAEMFKINENDIKTIKPGMIIAVDENNDGYYTLADKNSKCIVGVYSQNPAFCAGGDSLGTTIPVALMGRVNVLIDNMPSIGKLVIMSETMKGLGHCVDRKQIDKYENKTILGKITRVIDDFTAEILVNTN